MWPHKEREEETPIDPHSSATAEECGCHSGNVAGGPMDPPVFRWACRCRASVRRCGQSDPLEHPSGCWHGTMELSGENLAIPHVQGWVARAVLPAGVRHAGGRRRKCADENTSFRLTTPLNKSILSTEQNQRSVQYVRRRRARVESGKTRGGWGALPLSVFLSGISGAKPTWENRQSTGRAAPADRAGRKSPTGIAGMPSRTKDSFPRYNRMAFASG